VLDTGAVTRGSGSKNEDRERALLHKLMTGEIRVADLDLSALARPAAASTVIPAQAGSQEPGVEAVAPDPRVRGGDENRAEAAQ
jgi:hypothetical protein